MRFIITVILSLLATSTVAYPTAKISIQVIDSAGNPIEGANVGIGFEKAKSQGWGVDPYGYTGLTDSDGIYTAEGETGPRITYAVTKDGYYRTSGIYSNFTDVTGILGFRKYEPWNPTVDIVLKKINNPIPMYAMKRNNLLPEYRLIVPELDKYIGYDLIENDWVVPHGQGVHRDILFKVEVNRARSPLDYDVKLTAKFSNEGDGLLYYKPSDKNGQSAMRFPHHAPTSGYQSELIKHEVSAPDVMMSAGVGRPHYDNNYFFRVRTKLDKEGNVVGGMYGKIHGDISVANQAWLHEQEPQIEFTYYLNPNDNDTNIEFDTSRNLFKGVAELYQVKDP